MFGLRKIRSMKRHVVILFVLCVFYAFANQAVDDALQSVIQNGCLSNPRAAGQIEEWGVPERLFQEPSFTNLVSILNQELVNCDFAYVNALTGTVKRAAFVAALTKCGNVAYHDSLVRWFGQESLPAAANVKVCKMFVFPLGTNMEDYMDMHFDAPGISNVLNNVKHLHQGAGDSADVAAIDWILSGNSKASKMEDVQSGLVDRVRDGSTLSHAE